MCEIPQPIQDILPPAPPSDEFFGLIENAALESASMRLLGDAGFILSRGAGDAYLASVMLPGMSEEETAGGTTLARAIVVAMCRAILSRASS